MERAVLDEWQDEQLPEQAAAEIRDGLLDDLRNYTATTDRQRRVVSERVHAIKRERLKWAQKAMDETVPADIAREKQRQLADQLSHAQTQVAALESTDVDHAAMIRAATSLIANCGRAYAEADENTRRAYNQAWFEGIYLDIKDRNPVISRIDRTDVVEAVKTAVVTDPESSQTDTDHGDTTESTGCEVIDLDEFRPRVISRVRGLNESCLVELRGFEPLTPSMRTRCATGLRHSPWLRRTASGSARRPSIRVSARSGQLARRWDEAGAMSSL